MIGVTPNDMKWYLPLILQIALSNIAVPLLLKGKVATRNTKQRFMLFYVVCFGLTTLPLFALGKMPISSALVAPFLIGTIVALGNYAFWQATRMNLSATSLFLIINSILPLIFEQIWLREHARLSGLMLSGILLSVGAIGVFALYQRYGKKKRKGEPKERLPPSFFLYAGTFAVCFGISNFLVRVFALRSLPTEVFIGAWYAGTFFSSLLITLVLRMRTREDGTAEKTLSMNTVFVALLAITTILSVLVTFWTLHLAPLAVMSPIILVASVICPIVMGLFIFKENKHYDTTEWILFAAALTGSLLIALNFSQE